uniref:SJCHGC07229 protein n=1 Tax=Schistosoma japonicum TaxID=6182 RepID=Q5BRV8_SCHJA|nr:SJCHGC07229 protein [Schistosoma japonicum]
MAKSGINSRKRRKSRENFVDPSTSAHKQKIEGYSSRLKEFLQPYKDSMNNMLWSHMQ